MYRQKINEIQYLEFCDYFYYDDITKEIYHLQTDMYNLNEDQNVDYIHIPQKRRQIYLLIKLK